MKTIATSPTKEGIISLLNKFWYTTTIQLIGEELPYAVHNSKGAIEGAKVVKHRTGFKCILE